MRVALALALLGQALFPLAAAAAPPGGATAGDGGMWAVLAEWCLPVAALAAAVATSLHMIRRRRAEQRQLERETQ